MTDPQRKPQSLQITERRELSMKIAVAGTGYVGLSMAVLLAQNHEVTAVDVIPEKVALLQKGRSPIRDKEIKEYLAGGRLHLQATLDGEVAYRDAELVIVSTPTNYDPGIHFFDTGSVETVVETVRRVNPDAVIVIKSTVPVGYTVSLMEKYHTDRILFSPEFCGKGMHCMTICILPGSLWEQTQSPLKWRSMQDGLQSFCVRVRKNRRSPYGSWTLRKRRR